MRERRSFSSQPRRVLQVTGVETALTTARVISSILGTSRRSPAPAPLPATFLTGQPKLMSMKSGWAVSTIRAASAIASGSRP